MHAALEPNAPDRVGRTLAWGVGFSVLFHVVLFSPQLAAVLDPENRHEVIAELRKAARKPEDPAAAPKDRPDEPPKEDRVPKDPAAALPPPPPESGERPPAEPRPKPPEADQEQPPLPPIETPKPSPAYPDVEDVAIGQDEGDPMSVVIIGRDDYEEHMAQLSVVNQAGYRMSDAGGDGTVGYGRGDSGDGGGGGGSAPKATATTVAAAAPGTPPTPESTRTESAAPSPPPDAAPQPDNPPKPPDAAPATVAKADPKPQDAAEPVPPAPHVPASTDPSASEPVPPIDAPRDPQATPPEEAKPAPPAPPPPRPDPPVAQPKQPEAPSTTVVPAEQRPAAPPPANQPPPSQPGGGVASTERAKEGPADQAPGQAGRAGGQGPSAKPGTGGKGELSDLESPATSIVNVPSRQWRNGRLVAAVGVQLKPRQPQFTTLQLVSMLPSCQPPVVSLTFDREGRCVDVFFNRTSGDPEIDGVIRNSLFFWRATGKKIDALQGDEKVRVTLQLLL